MNTTLQGLMRAATRLTQSGRLGEATDVIRRALGHLPGAGPAAGAEPMPMSMPLPLPTPFAELGADVAARVQPERRAAFQADAPAGLGVPPTAFRPPFGMPSVDAEARTPPADAEQDIAGTAGQFSSGRFTHAGLVRDYKLYLPPGAADRPMPLVVMLHGCTQDPDDFAAGTGMNHRALEQGFAVLYPAQSQGANPARCWNWFKHNHQQRGHGEPALIAALAQAVVRAHGLDARRVYIAGLSAGGAMAALVAAAYPELFAAVGVHSGLAPGAASNLSEGMAAMQGHGQPRGAGAGSSAAGAVPVPAIVFHGDADSTVHPRNGEQVINALAGGSAAATVVLEQGTSPNGRRYTRGFHAGAANGTGSLPHAEHWVVHGAGHAWSGGRTAGSYTDPTGPDATAEMLRFFFERRQAPRPAAS